MIMAALNKTASLSLFVMLGMALLLIGCSNSVDNFLNVSKASEQPPANLLASKDVLASNENQDLWLAETGEILPENRIIEQSPQLRSNKDIAIERFPKGDIQTDTVTYRNDQNRVEQTKAVPYEDINRAQKIKVAILLPLSGEHEKVGRAILNAAQMALFDIAGDYFELIPRDTKGSVKGAEQAAISAVNNGAKLILGPLFARNARAVKPVARKNDLKIITFSTDWTLADRNTYVMGFMPFDQVQRVMRFAAEQGLVDQAALAPYTAYGDVVTRTFSAVANRTPLINPVMIERYRAGDENFNDLVRKFTQYDERVLQLEEAIAEIEIIPEEERTEDEMNELARLKIQHTEGDLPFQAIVLPMGGTEVRAVTSVLKFYDVDLSRARFLGTGLWDDPSIYNEVSMRGAWYAAPSPKNRASFETKYQSVYGEKPLRIATLGYDATALAAILARQDIVSGDRNFYDYEDLTNPNGFVGLDGIFRFSGNGLVERGLAVMEITKRGPRIISPAPKTFQFERF